MQLYHQGCHQAYYLVTKCKIWPTLVTKHHSDKNSLRTCSKYTLFLICPPLGGEGGVQGKVWELPRIILKPIDSTIKIDSSHRTGLQKFGFAR